jgi:uncharacterized protein
MQYRPLGKTGLQVSALGLGCMRFDPDKPELAEQIVDEAIASGINYFETTRIYIQGRCQHLTAPGLKGRSRGLIVSGKGAVNEDTTADSFRKEMDLQMEILGVDYLEFYQVGWLSLDKMEFVTRPGGVLEALDKARDEGIIGHVGFTGHDAPENVAKMIETGIFDSVTLVYNLLNRSQSPVIQRAGELGVGVVVMCPVGGGMLSRPSAQLQGLSADETRSLPGTALQFVLSNPNVSTAVSGMTTLEELRENVASVSSFRPMNEDDVARVESVLDEFASIGREFCTACGYCMDCPQGVDIPRNFRLYNYARVYGLVDWAKERYAAMKPEKRADACVRCGECEPRCPNGLPVMDHLEDVDEMLGLS